MGRWEISLGVEHTTDNREVGGSNPPFPIRYFQIANAPLAIW